MGGRASGIRVVGHCNVTAGAHRPDRVASGPAGTGRPARTLGMTGLLLVLVNAALHVFALLLFGFAVGYGLALAALTLLLIAFLVGALAATALLCLPFAGSRLPAL